MYVPVSARPQTYRGGFGSGPHPGGVHREFLPRPLRSTPVGGSHQSRRSSISICTGSTASSASSWRSGCSTKAAVAGATREGELAEDGGSVRPSSMSSESLSDKLQGIGRNVTRPVTTLAPSSSSGSASESFSRSSAVQIFGPMRSTARRGCCTRTHTIAVSDAYRERDAEAPWTSADLGAAASATSPPQADRRARTSNHTSKPKPGS